MMEALTAEQQEHVDGLIGSARVKARAKAKTEFETATTKAAEAAEKAKLEAAGEWKAIAEKNATRVKELEPLVARVKQYEAAETKRVEARMKTLSKEAKAALKDLPESMAMGDKIDWLEKHTSLVDVADDVGTPNRQKPKDDKSSAGARRLTIPVRL